MTMAITHLINFKTWNRSVFGFEPRTKVVMIAHLHFYVELKRKSKRIGQFWLRFTL